MDEDDDKDDSKRRTRNLSEKKRRDQFNLLLNELGTMVATNSRKMDKSTVLKSTISFLKNHNEITAQSRVHDVQEDWKPTFMSNEEFTYLVLEAMEGFVMVFSLTGCIYYVSESITSLLGHNVKDIVNKSIYDITFEEDHTKLYELLQHPIVALHPNQTVEADNVIRFQCHLRRGALNFQNEVTYERVQFNGHFRMNMEQNESSNDIPYQQDRDTRLLFVCTGRLCTPQLIRDVSLVDSKRNEFTSRHSLEWKFLFLDHRAPPIIGYLPFEVLGTSGYDYYHFDDLEKVVLCHEDLMQKGEVTSGFYRFLTKGQQWIWLQTRYYITYHQWNAKPEFVVCTHRVVSSADIDKSTKQESKESKAMTESDSNEGNEKGVEDCTTEDAIVPMSPSYLSDISDAFCNSYQSISQPPSVKSVTTSTGSTVATVATAGTTTTAAGEWQARLHARYHTESGTASNSGEERTQRNTAQEMDNRMTDPPVVPQHGIGAQYLEPVPFVGVPTVPAMHGMTAMTAMTAMPAMSTVLPLSLQTIPVIMSPDQTQLQLLWQEQLQRTHRELQQMIVRQQEELRQVKEQLLLARLGMSQPAINDPYGLPDGMQQSQQPRMTPQMRYDGRPSRQMYGMPSQHQGHHHQMPPN